MRHIYCPWLAAALLAGCAAPETDGAGGSGPLPGPAEWNREVTPPSDAEATQGRASCAYQAGALPAETQGASQPNSTEIPIDHILVVMMENRSFDHYFQTLPEHGQPDVDVAPADFSNPDAGGDPVAIFHDTAYCFVDTSHSWAGTSEQIGGGQMNGFVTSNEGHGQVPPGGTAEMLSGRRAMSYYEPTDLPFYYWLAAEFAIGDRYFASVPGPTWPNRMYLYAASSFGIVRNTIPPEVNTILDYLELRQIDWKIYAAGTPGIAMFLSVFLDYQADHIRTLDDYFADAAAGKLPAFAFIDPPMGLGTGQYDGEDEHPPAMAPLGERWVAKVIDALTKSPAWPRSALFLNYDEHGGLYDHVPPPAACPPDGLTPALEPGEPAGEFDTLGVRTPFIVVSPYAKKNFVSHQQYDHTSVLRFVEARFVMPALTERDANAYAPWDMFDFDDPPHLDPPHITIPEIDQAKIDACQAIFE